MKSNKIAILMIIILASFFGGGIGAMMKIGLRNIPPFSFSFLRYFVALIFIWPLFLKENKKIKFDFEVIKVALFLAVNIILFIVGLQWTLVNVSQLLCLGIPAIVTIISYFTVKEKITVKKIAGIIIGFIGSFLLLSFKFKGGLDYQQMLIGNGLIIIGSVFYSFYLVFSKKVQKKYSPVYIITVINIIIMLVSLFLAVSDLYLYQNWWQKLNIDSFVSVLYAGILGTSVTFVLVQYAIKYGSPLISSLGLYIQPLFTFIWAYLLLGETLSGNLLISAIIIFIGAWMVTRES